MQPYRGASMCGQCCLAMILGKTLDEVASLVGHRRSTFSRELIAVLRAHGYDVPDRMQRRPLPQKYSRALLKASSKRGRKHWLLLWDSRLFCPDLGPDPIAYGGYDQDGWKITSYLPLEKKA
jgi:hypothetical protein